jgi:hypothetical protein
MMVDKSMANMNHKGSAMPMGHKGSAMPMGHKGSAMPMYGPAKMYGDKK